jgi:hypothetical protein
LEDGGEVGEHQQHSRQTGQGSGEILHGRRTGL